MQYFVYILFSESHNRTYVGQTQNLTNRLAYHNSGKVTSTKPYLPWELIYSEVCNSRSEAMKKEKWFKSSAGRKKISEILNHHLSAETNGLSVPSR